MVTRFVLLMGVSRYGLSQRELMQLLSPGDSKAEPAIADDELGNVAAMIQLLRPYLMRRGELLDFYHSQFRAAVDKAYLRTEAQRGEAHKTLAQYFRNHANPLEEGTWTENNPRDVSELPHHLMNAEMWYELENTLTDLMFIEAKCKAGMPHDLVGDYLLAIGVLPHKSIRLSAFSRFVKRHIDLLDHEPHLVFQLAANEPDASPVSQSAMKRWRSGIENRLWLRHLNKPQIQSQFNFIYYGHKSAGEGGGGTSNWLTCCCYSPDGSLVASADYKGSVHICEADTGKLIRVLTVNDHGATSCTWSPDSRFLVVTCKGKLLVWNVVNGRLHRILTEHSAEDITCCHLVSRRSIRSLGRRRI